MKKIFKFFRGLLLLALMMMLLTACAGLETPPEGLANFFAGFEWQELVGLFIGAVFSIFPGASVGIFNWLKNKFKVKDRAAHTLVLTACIVLTAAAMWVTGALNLTDYELTLANMLATGSFVYVGSQIAWQRLKEGK